MLRPVCLSFLLFTLVKPCLSQDVKELDHRTFYAGKSLAGRTCREVYFRENQAVDTLMVSSETYDKQGRLLTSEFYNRKGEKEYVIEYHYDEAGRLSGNILYTAALNWEGQALRLEFDEKQRLIARETESNIPGCWRRQEFHYDQNGNLATASIFYDSNGKLVLYRTEHYEDLTEQRENSLSHIYDQHGLLIVEQSYSNGIADHSRIYDYRFHRKK